MSGITVQLPSGRWVGESLDGSLHVADTEGNAHLLAAQHNLDELDKLTVAGAMRKREMRGFSLGGGPLAEAARERNDDIAHAGRFDEAEL